MHYPKASPNPFGCPDWYEDEAELFLFLSALSDEEKQQVISSAIIPVFFLGILTSYSNVSLDI
jgi:hypothetical protein